MTPLIPNPPPAPLEVSLEEAVRMVRYERQHYTWKILAEKARTNAWHGFTVRKLYPGRH